MRKGKFNKFLTIFLIIVVIAIISLVGYFIYEAFMKWKVDGDADKEVEEFENAIKAATIIDYEEEENNSQPETNPGDKGGQTTGGSNINLSGRTYKGLPMAGIIEIPAIGIKYPVIAEETRKSIEVAVAILVGPGLNKIGNTTIAGHNFKNGTFFSNNKKLEKGDKIYITDLSGQRIEYTIYSKYTTTPQDGSYINRDTEGRRELTLITCTDNIKSRLIIWAKEST